MSRNFTSSLMTTDFKATRFPQAVVKQNSVPDRNELVRRSNLPRNAAKKPLFAMPGLGGDLTDAAVLLHEGDLAFRVINTAWGEGVSVESTMQNQSIAVKCVSVLNGMVGTPEEIEATIEIVGKVEQGNGESRTNVSNVVCGGGDTCLYNSPTPCRMNGLLMGYVPSEAIADKMMNDKASHVLGREGAVCLGIKEYDPKEMKYLSPAGMLFWFNMDDPNNKMPMKQAVEQLPEMVIDIINAFTPPAVPLDAKIIRQRIIRVLNDYVTNGIVDVLFLNMLHQCVMFMAQAKVQRERMVFGRAHQPAVNGNYLPFHFIHYAY